MIQTVPLPSTELRDIVASQVLWTRDAQWSALFGGRTNSAWQVTDGSNALVLKLYRAHGDNPLFPNDPTAEAQMLRFLGDIDLAPQLVAEFDSRDGHCILYQAIPGKPWAEGTKAVAKMMQKLHALPCPENLRGVANGSDAIMAQAHRILAKCADTSLISPLRPKIEIAPSTDQALLHCDIVPGNLIENHQGLFLIDWQCPAIGDPIEDIAIFLSPAMQTLYRGHPLSSEERDTFLNNYRSQAARYEALAPAYHFRMAAYCQWQVERGFPDYAAGRDAEITALNAYL